MEKALDAIADVDDSVAPLPAGDASSAEAPPALPRGAYAPAIIVLLTDGASNAGPLPVEAAAEAAARGIRIYTIGMGNLVRMSLGTRPETSESILKRVANDRTSPDFVAFPDELEGKYYYAETSAHVAAAFQALQNEIIRLTK